MRKVIVLLFLLAGVNTLYSFSGEEILKNSDSTFIPVMAKLKMRLELYEGNKYKRYYEFECYLKGNRKYLLIFKNPPIVRQRAQLRVGNVIWNYLGKINKTTKMSARAMFLDSTFTQEDIMNSTLNYLYKVEKTETVTLNQTRYYKLYLKAKSKKTAYYRIITYINADSLLPLKRDYFSFSNQKIKEMKILNIIRSKGKTKEISLSVYDTLRPGRYTKVRFYDIDTGVNLPDRMFTERYMELAAR